MNEAVLNPEGCDGAYAGWAILELMGHRRVAGQVREVTMYGACMLRVDIPAPESGGVTVTQYYGGAAVYCLTPATEEAARKVLGVRYGLPGVVQLALPPSRDEEDSEYLDA